MDSGAGRTTIGARSPETLRSEREREKKEKETSGNEIRERNLKRFCFVWGKRERYANGVSSFKFHRVESLGGFCKCPWVLRLITVVPTFWLASRRGWLSVSRLLAVNVSRDFG